MPSRSNLILIGVSLSLAVALLLSLRSCNNHKQNSEGYANYIESAKDTIRFLKDSSIAQKKVIVANKEVLKDILQTRADLRKALAEAKIKAKNVNSITTVVSHVVVKDSIVIKHDTIPCDEFEVPFSVDVPDYSIHGKIDNETVTITKVDFPDSLSIITFTDRHLFKRNELKVSVQHSNPYIRTTGLENFTVREKKKWWEAKWIPAVAGLVGGYFLFK